MSQGQGQGKEAARMRKALFAVVLVFASFAGGAIVNGPGLRWAQAVVFSRMGLEGEGGDGDGGDLAPAGSQAEEIPARPIPPLVIDTPTPSPAPTAGAPSGEKAGPVEGPPARAATATRPAPGDRAVASSSSSALPGLAPVPEGTPAQAPLDPPPPLTTPRERERDVLALAVATSEPPVSVPDRDRPPAEAEGQKGSGRDGDGPTDKDKDKDKDGDKDRDTSVRRISLVDPAGDEPAAVPSEPADWAGVRDTMRTLGVSRFGVEGEPAGRVRFYCVIPLAGRRAVGQHFEAEADDALQAARAALKRVALWRASEPAGRTP
jgi:hypothetical protein